MTTDNELRALALAYEGQRWSINTADDGTHAILVSGVLVCEATTANRARYIAAASPDRIVALLDRVQQLEAGLADALQLASGWGAHEDVAAMDRLRKLLAGEP